MIWLLKALETKSTYYKSPWWLPGKHFPHYQLYWAFYTLMDFVFSRLLHSYITRCVVKELSFSLYCVAVKKIRNKNFQLKSRNRKWPPLTVHPPAPSFCRPRRRPRISTQHHWRSPDPEGCGAQRHGGLSVWSHQQARNHHPQHPAARRQ